MFSDLPPVIEERVVCSIAAGVRYNVPVNLLLAVAEREGGKPGQWVKNTNGTYDVGSLQFNTSYLATLRSWGITPADAARPGCYPFDLAAWRLRGHLQKDKGDMWQRAANYHSRTPVYNSRYRAGIIAGAARWGAWLAARVPTYELGSAVASAATATPAATVTQAVSRGYVPRTITFARD